MNVGVMKFLRETGTFLKKGTIAFVGDSAFFKEECQRVYKKALKLQYTLDVDFFDPEVRVEDFKGKKQDVKMERIEESLSEPPMIGNYRYVLVRNADKVKNIVKLSDYIKEPSHEHKVLFGFSPDVEKSLYESMGFELIVVCNEMNTDTKEFEKFITYCLAPTGKSISPDAKELVKKIFANNLGWMQQEINKVSLYIGDRLEITLQDLMTALASYPVAQVFDLVDSVVIRDVTTSLKTVEELMEKGVEPTFLTYLITQRLQVIAAASRAYKNGESLKSFMIRKKIPLFQYDQVLSGLKNLRDLHLSHMFETLAWTEYYAKKGKDHRLITQMMVVNLCGGVKTDFYPVQRYQGVT